MKLRKPFALLMTAVMLLGLVPAASAEACNHGWQHLAYRWPNGEPANCQQQALREAYCTLCGAVTDSWNDAGDHTPGSWYWDGDPPSNCQDRGIQNINCAVCGETYSEREVYGDHKWHTQTVRQPDCTTPGSKETTCSICGDEKGAPEEIPALGHDWGSWRWAHGSAPTCTEGAWQVRECKRCGQMEDKWVPAGSHKWGSWNTVTPGDCSNPAKEQRACSVCGTTESRQGSYGDHKFSSWRHYSDPTCTEKGWNYKQCSVCGVEDWKDIDPVDHVFGEWYVVTEPRVGVPGLEQRDCTYGCGTHEDRDIPPLEAPVVEGGFPEGEYGEITLPGEPEIDPNDIPQMWCAITLDKEPANGTFFVPGETAHFSVAYENPSDYDVINARIYGQVQDTPVHNSGNELAYNMPIVDAPVASHDFGSFTVSHTVTEADAARGAIYAEAGFWADLPNGIPVYEYITVPLLMVPCGAAEGPGDMGLTPALSLTKEVFFEPDNGSFYVPGERISFSIVLTNTSDVTLYNVDLYDPLHYAPHLANYSELAPGEQRKHALIYLISDLDAANGAVFNNAYVTAYDADGNEYVEYSNTVSAPCGFPDAHDPFGTFHSVSVVKKEESQPRNGQYYTEGEVIHYSITYTNDGEQPITNVDVWDVMDIAAPIASAEMLNPGESRVCYYQHTVTAEDVAFGSVMNVAHASYPVPNRAGFVSSCSEPVYSKTSGGEDFKVLMPMFPLPGKKPDYDPGTGWFPSGDPAPEAGMPPFGTINVEALRGGNTYCERTVTGRDNVSVSYETSFCAEHADTQASVLMMTQAALTPEMQAQSAAYAVALWRSEVEKLYQQIIEASDPTAKTVVMTEYIRFLTDVANYEAVLKQLYPDQPAVAAQKVAALWEDKCVTLCYETYADAVQRKDSLLSVTPAAGAASASCGCTVTSAENGKKNETQSYCPMHGFPYTMIDALLQGKDTAEAWTMVRQIWGVELNNAYQQLSAKLGENSVLATVEYNALTQWMMAREASLMALYPDHPEIVAQTMVKCIMDRVNALCQVTK